MRAPRAGRPSVLTWGAMGGGAAAVGAVAGFVIGLFAYWPTALFAALEVAIPAGVVGFVVGVVAGVVARIVHAIRHRTAVPAEPGR